MQEQATEYLKARHELTESDGTPRAQMMALEDRIVQTALQIASRVTARPLAPLATFQLRAFLNDELEPTEEEVLGVLRGRDAMKRRVDGEPHAEIVALADRIIEASLALASRVLAMASDHMNVDELRSFRSDVVDAIEREVTQRLSARGALADEEGKPPDDLTALRARAVAITLAMAAQVASKPLKRLTFEELRHLRDQELEPMLAETTEDLSKRGALLAEGGRPHKEMRRLNERLVQATLAMVNRLVAEPIKSMDINELREFRMGRLEAAQREVLHYLEDRGQLLARDGTERPDLIALEDRIIEISLMMAMRAIAMPVDHHELSVDELRMHRQQMLEAIEVELASFLRGRIATTTKGVETQAVVVEALSNRIVECTLQMMASVSAIPIEDLSASELLSLRTDKLEPIEAETASFLRNREASHGLDGELVHAEKSQLSERIVEVTLLALNRLLEKPLSPLGISELEALRDNELHPALHAATAYLEKREKLRDAKGRMLWPHFAQVEKRMVEATLETVMRAIEMPLDGMSVEELRAHRTGVLEHRQRVASADLASRGKRLGADGDVEVLERMERLEARIVECTLAMVRRTLEISFGSHTKDELAGLRKQILEPMERSTEQYLSRRDAMVTLDGNEHPELLELRALIVDVTLARVERLLAVPISRRLSMDELLAQRTNELEVMQKETLLYLDTRGAAEGRDGLPWPQLVALEARIIRVTLLMAKRLATLPIDDMGIDELRTFRKQELEPGLLAMSEYLDGRGALEDPEKGGIRKELAALEERIEEVEERAVDLEVTQMLDAVAKLAAMPIEQLSIPELGAYRVSKLEPMREKATAYLASRDALLVRGEKRVEMAELDDRISETYTRVPELEALSMLKDVAEVAALLSLPGAMRDMKKEDLTEVRVGTLETKLHEATEFLDQRGWLMARDGMPHAEITALQSRILHVLNQEMNLMLREVTRACDLDSELEGQTVEALNTYRQTRLEPMLQHATDYLNERDGLMLTSGAPRPEMVTIQTRIQEVKDRVLRMEVREVLDEIAGAMDVDLEMMTVVGLREHCKDVLVPLHAKVTAFLTERGVLLERGNRERPQLAELAERIEYIPRRARELELEELLGEMQAKATRPMEALSIAELAELRTEVLEPMLTRAKQFFAERGLTTDHRPEFTALDQRIEETIVQAIELTVAPVVKELVDATAREPKSKTIDDLHTLRVDELEPLQKRAEAFLAREGALRSRTDGGRRAELVAVEKRIEELHRREVALVSQALNVEVAKALPKASVSSWATDLTGVSAMLAELEATLTSCTARLTELGALESDGATRSELLALRARVLEVRGRKGELEAIEATKDAAEVKKKLGSKQWSATEMSALMQERAEAERRAFNAKKSSEEAAFEGARVAAETAAADRKRKQFQAKMAQEREKQAASPPTPKQEGSWQSLRGLSKRPNFMQLAPPPFGAPAALATPMSSLLSSRDGSPLPGRAAKGRLGMHDVLSVAQAGSFLGAGRNADGTLNKSASAAVLPPTRTPPRGSSPGTSLQHAADIEGRSSFRDVFAAAQGQGGAASGGLAAVASALPPLRKAPLSLMALPPLPQTRPPQAVRSIGQPTLHGSQTTASLLSPRSAASCAPAETPMRLEPLSYGPVAGGTITKMDADTSNDEDIDFSSLGL